MIGRAVSRSSGFVEQPQILDGDHGLIDEDAANANASSAPGDTGRGLPISFALYKLSKALLRPTAIFMFWRFVQNSESGDYPSVYGRVFVGGQIRRFSLSRRRQNSGLADANN